MGVKLEANKYIKNKIKEKFGELEVYNPQFDNEIYTKLITMINENSQQIELENGLSDIQVNNTVKMFREMLICLTNIEDKSYWNGISDYDLENMLNLADGNFKKVVNSLLDIMIEIGRDIRTENIRKLNILNDKLLEISEAIKTNMEIDKTLASFGLDRNKLVKLQNGDEDTIKEFQKNLLEQKNNKSKRNKSKKNK
jgi:hypothetical protein